MQSDTAIAGLAQTIQVSIAPVFLLTGVGAFLAVLTNRLARVIDRTRALQERPAQTDEIAEELRVLRLRGRQINRAVGLCTYSALLVAGVIAALFVGAVARVDFSIAVAIAFVAAMTTFIAGLICFLREVQLATRYMREATRW